MNDTPATIFYDGFVLWSDVVEKIEGINLDVDGRLNV